MSLGNEEEELQYQLSFRYQVLDQNQHPLYQQETTISWNQGTKNTTDKEIGKTWGKVTIEVSFDKIKIPPPGKIKISTSLNKDDIHEANAGNIELIVYDNVYEHYPLVITGTVSAIAGIIALISGLICLAKRSTEPHKTRPTSIYRPTRQTGG